MIRSRLVIGKQRRGFMLLITILVIGAIASAILSSLLLLGISANQVGLNIQQSAQAFSLANACAEYAILKLRQSPQYPGAEFVSVGGHQCEILTIGGVGNNNRTICAEGTIGEAVRRLEIAVNQVIPQTTIYSWQEVPVFTLCD